MSMETGAHGGSKRKRKDRKKRRNKKANVVTMFSHPLNEVVLHESSSMEGRVLVTPLIVDMLIEEITKEHLDTQGLFRTCGSQAAFTPLVDALKEGKAVTVRGRESTFLCSMLKQILREMHTSVVSGRVKAQLMEIVAADSPSIESVVAVLAEMPCFEMAMLARIMEFLSDVAAHSEQNKMDIQNLAIVFGPTMLQGSTADGPRAHATDNPEDIIRAEYAENGLHIAIFKVFLQNKEELFSIADATEKVRLKLEEDREARARTPLGAIADESASKKKRRIRGDNFENSHNPDGFVTPTRPSKRRAPLLRQVSRRASVRNLLKMTEDMAHANPMQSPRGGISHATKFAQKHVVAAASGSLPTRRRAPVERISIANADVFPDSEAETAS